MRLESLLSPVGSHNSQTTVSRVPTLPTVAESSSHLLSALASAETAFGNLENSNTIANVSRPARNSNARFYTRKHSVVTTRDLCANSEQAVGICQALKEISPRVRGSDWGFFEMAIPE